jgi:transposase
MAAAIGLRNDFESSDLRALAKTTRDASQARRVLALAEIYDGGSRTDAARIGGVGLQTVRDWVVRFNTLGPDGLIDGKAPGNTAKLNAEQRAALAQIVEHGPIPAVHGVVRWRLIDLAQWVLDEFGIAVSEATMSRELKALGYAKLSARPRHYAQNELAVADFKKRDFQPSWRRSAPGSRQARI